MKKGYDFNYWRVSVLSLVACTPKRYERQSKTENGNVIIGKKEKKDTGQKYYFKRY